MNNVKKTEGAFVPVVFDSVIDTYPGGVTLKSVSSFKDSDGNIPAGTLIGIPDEDGQAKPVKVDVTGEEDGAAKIDDKVLGILHVTVNGNDDHIWASVVLKGTIRTQMVNTESNVDSGIKEAVEEAIPTMNVID